jgi:hypothetical protein
VGGVEGGIVILNILNEDDNANSKTVETVLGQSFIPNPRLKPWAMGMMHN